MNTQQHQALPSLTDIAEHFRALSDQPYDPATISEADARRLKTAAGETQDNAVAALMLIADLIAEYPAGTGNDEQMLRQTGNAVRVLAEVLELTAEAVEGYGRNPTVDLMACAAGFLSA